MGETPNTCCSGSINIRTSHCLSLVRLHQRAEDFGTFLDKIHSDYWAWEVVLFLNGDSSHTAKATEKLGEQHRIELMDLPKRSPELNSMDHLWRHSKSGVLANRQFASIDGSSGNPSLLHGSQVDDTC